MLFIRFFAGFLAFYRGFLNFYEDVWDWHCISISVSVCVAPTMSGMREGSQKTKPDEVKGYVSPTSSMFSCTYLFTNVTHPLNKQRASFMKIIRLPDVIESTGLARSTIYKFIALNAFPKPVPLGERCVGWVESEVVDWVLSKIAARDVAAESK